MGDQRGREKNVKPLFRPDVSQDGRKVGLTEEKLLFIPSLFDWKPKLHTEVREGS